MDVAGALKRIVDDEHLSSDEAYEVMLQVISGEAQDVQVAALLTALRMRGESIEEIVGFARAMRDKALRIQIDRQPLVDTCGTGGDGARTFNISTAAAFVVAGAGVAVAKHGNRSVTSQCGSADVLEELGYNLNMPPEMVKQCIEEVGIGFLFAPLFHPAMRNVAHIRQKLGIRTVFNILGPLTNPANITGQTMGVFSPHLSETLAKVLCSLGLRRAFVVHSHDGLDEVSPCAPTLISELRYGDVHTYELVPAEFGFGRGSLNELRINSREDGVRLLLGILNGDVRGCPREAVLLNAALGIIAGELCEDIGDGIKLAEEAIDSGRAIRCLNGLIQFSKRVSV
ncbi:MAG: anthranilate phosphoribosyltransferase [Armatimonadetes bacterium]|nr:anthranilate phosphoribosyltransferase [Armatimonadota bacterium]MCX7777777.1 anthranilate phosphoribosyltransferase [Armatimonadota bacterium]